MRVTMRISSFILLTLCLTLAFVTLGSAQNCSSLTGCFDCATTPGCGWCGSRCRGGTPSGPHFDVGCNNSSWIFGSDEGESKCPTVDDPGQSQRTCPTRTSYSSCLLVAGCEWCSNPSSSSGGNCQSTLEGCERSWSTRTHRALYARNCISVMTCSSCQSMAGCGWCSLDTVPSASGYCVDSGTFGAYGENWCTSSPLWSYSESTCAPSYIIDDDSTLVPVIGSYPSKSHPAIPMLVVVFVLSIIGWTIFGCLRGFTPQYGSKVDTVNFLTPYTSNLTWTVVFYCVHVAGFALYLAAAANDVYTEAASDTASFKFGAIQARFSGADKDQTGTYHCPSSSIDSDDAKFCYSFLFGGIMTLVYESIGVTCSFVALLYALYSTRKGVFFSTRVWSLTGIATVCAGAGLVNWATTTHLCLEAMKEQSEFNPDMHFGPSWVILFPAIFLHVIALIFWRGRIENLPSPPNASATVGIAMATPPPSAHVPVYPVDAVPLQQSQTMTCYPNQMPCQIVVYAPYPPGTQQGPAVQSRYPIVVNLQYPPMLQGQHQQHQQQQHQLQQQQQQQQQQEEPGYVAPPPAVATATADTTNTTQLVPM